MSGLPVVYCDNYVQAALAAHARGLLTTDATFAVAQAAVNEYHAILMSISNRLQFAAAVTV